MESPTRNVPHLQPVSPDRVNRMPSSPSMSINTADPFIASPGGSVQGKVAQFNNLSKEVSQKRKDNEAALRRAVLGREEAEGETRRLREENANLKQKLEEARARDQRVAKKFEAFSEEKRKLMEHQHKVQHISDQEVRRARKEAFKYSSALVTAQEDLQKARGHMEKLNDQANIERNRGQKYQQEAFDMKIALSDVEEELDVLKKQLQAVEEERNVLRTNLNDEQIARVAAEGRIPLPTSSADDEFASPRKSKQRRVSRRVSSRRESLKENMDPAVRNSNDIFDIMWAAEEGDEFAVAKRNLWVEEKRRQEAEIMIKYLKSEYDRKPKLCTCGGHLHEHGQAGLANVQDSIVGISSAAELMEMDADLLMDHQATLGEGTVIHYELGPEEIPNPEEEEVISPSVQSEPPPFIIHEDSDDASPPHIEASGPTTLAPVAPSTSPSLLNLESNVDKENEQASPRPRLSSSRMSNIGASMAETSILSIKSEDLDDSDRSHSYALTPRPPPNAIVPSREPTPANEKLEIPPAEIKIQRQRTPVQDVVPEIVPTASQVTPATSDLKVTPLIRSNTTTVSIPLKGGSPEKSSAKDYPFSPGATMTREQALEAIKQRRRRARSVHDGNSGKALGDLLRRDVSTKSAPA